MVIHLEFWQLSFMLKPAKTNIC